MEAGYLQFAKEHGISAKEARPVVALSKSIAKTKEKMLLSIRKHRKIISSTQAEIEIAAAQLAKNVQKQLETASKAIKSNDDANESTVDVYTSNIAALLKTVNEMIFEGLDASSPVVTRARDFILVAQVLCTRRYFGILSTRCKDFLRVTNASAFCMQQVLVMHSNQMGRF